MYALRPRGIAGLVCLCCSSLLTAACGSPDKDRDNSGQNVQGPAGFGNFGGFASVPLGTGNTPNPAGFGGAATGGVILTGQGGIIASGGALPAGTGGVIDPGPKPTGQILDCRGTGPCRIDDGDACCIGASVRNGVVESISENCIPPTASCNYPFTIAWCDGPEDCRQSEACCGTLKPFGDAQLFGQVECVPATECAGSQKLVVCRPGMSACPGTTTCGTFPTLPPDIMVCR